MSKVQRQYQTSYCSYYRHCYISSTNPKKVQLLFHLFFSLLCHGVQSTYFYYIHHQIPALPIWSSPSAPAPTLSYFPHSISTVTHPTPSADEADLQLGDAISSSQQISSTPPHYQQHKRPFKSNNCKQNKINKKSLKILPKYNESSKVLFLFLFFFFFQKPPFFQGAQAV